MCPLYSNILPPELMRQLFMVKPGLDHLGNAQSLPSIFPKTVSPMVTIGPTGERHLERAHWGFVLPQRSTRTGLPIQPKAVNNARDDKLKTSRFWKSSFENRRCLVPATSFCEPKGKKPATYFWFGLKGEDPRPPFAFAGIWTFFDGIYGHEPRKTLTSTIITTKPNRLVAEVHPDRMPVIFEPHRYQTWLTGTAAEAFDLIAPFPAEKMTIHQSGEEMKSDHGAVP